MIFSLAPGIWAIVALLSFGEKAVSQVLHWSKCAVKCIELRRMHVLRRWGHGRLLFSFTAVACFLGNILVPTFAKWAIGGLKARLARPNLVNSPCATKRCDFCTIKSVKSALSFLLLEKVHPWMLLNPWIQTDDSMSDSLTSRGYPPLALKA